MLKYSVWKNFLGELFWAFLLKNVVFYVFVQIFWCTDFSNPLMHWLVHSVKNTSLTLRYCTTTVPNMRKVKTWLILLGEHLPVEIQKTAQTSINWVISANNSFSSSFLVETSVFTTFNSMKKNQQTKGFTRFFFQL